MKSEDFTTTNNTQEMEQQHNETPKEFLTEALVDYDDSKTGETVVFSITNNPNTYTTNIFKMAN